jgi:hypothetical protein
MFTRLRVYLASKIGIRLGEKNRVNPGGHGWTKPVSPPSKETRPSGLPKL